MFTVRAEAAPLPRLPEDRGLLPRDKNLLKRGNYNMNKTELIAAAAEKTGLTKKDTEKVLNAALEAIADALAKNDKVQVSGFGIFEVKEREARMGRNPRTGETMEIAASRMPAFKASKTLKDAISK